MSSDLYMHTMAFLHRHVCVHMHTYTHKHTHTHTNTPSPPQEHTTQPSGKDGGRDEGKERERQRQRQRQRNREGENTLFSLFKKYSLDRFFLPLYGSISANAILLESWEALAFLASRTFCFLPPIPHTPFTIHLCSMS